MPVTTFEKKYLNICNVISYLMCRTGDYGNAHISQYNSDIKIGQANTTEYPWFGNDNELLKSLQFEHNVRSKAYINN